MKSSARLTFFICLSLWSSSLFAESTEEARLRGFAQHQKENERFDAARRQGERAYLEEEEQWENQKARALDEHKRSKRDEAMAENGPEATADATAKKAFADSYEQSRRDYLAGKSRDKIVNRQQKSLPSESEELGIAEARPRYDYRKRAMYGAKPKYGKASPGPSGSVFGGGSSLGGSSGQSFPPPPTFDDFGDGPDGGYVPAPNMSDDFGGDVPPPPPPPPPFGEDFGGDMGGDGDFPPPPPPPPFEGGGDF